MEVDAREDLVEDLATDIVDEHVDPVGAQLRKPMLAISRGLMGSPRLILGTQHLRGEVAVTYLHLVHRDRLA